MRETCSGAGLCVIDRWRDPRSSMESMSDERIVTPQCITVILQSLSHETALRYDGELSHFLLRSLLYFQLLLPLSAILQLSRSNERTRIFSSAGTQQLHPSFHNSARLPFAISRSPAMQFVEIFLIGVFIAIMFILCGLGINAYVKERGGWKKLPEMIRGRRVRGGSTQA